MSEPCFTLEEVAENNGAASARTWIIIKNVIYDVTDYLNEHPGGSELLLEYAGKDGTAAFDDFGHSSDAKNIMRSYRIGQLAECSPLIRSRKDGGSESSVKDNGRKSKTKDGRVKNDGTPKNRRSFLRVVCGGCL